MSHRKKILLVEDNGIVAENLENNFLEYDIETAYSVNSALDRWEDEGPFDCIILDLQISPDGLTPNENGLYTPLFGMAVINKLGAKFAKEELSEFRKKIIIYSGFIKELKDHSWDNKEIWNTRGLCLLEKSALSIDEITKYVNNLLK